MADTGRSFFGGGDIGLTGQGDLAHQVMLQMSVGLSVAGTGSTETVFDQVSFADGGFELGEPGALPYEDDYFLIPDDFTAVYPKVAGLYIFHFGGSVDGGAGATNLYVDVTLPSFGPCQHEVTVDASGFRVFGSTQNLIVLPSDIALNRYFLIEFRKSGSNVTVYPNLRLGFVKAL